jgi:hypothetical protein
MVSDRTTRSAPDVKSFRDKEKHSSNTRLGILLLATLGLVILNIFQVRLCALCVSVCVKII